MLKLIEILEDSAYVDIEGQRYPGTCILEDDDAIRYLLFSNVDVTQRVWMRAHAAGVTYLVRFLTGQFQFLTTDLFVERRGLTRREDFIPPSKGWVVFSHWPSFTELSAPSQEPQEALRHGFVHLHAHSEFSALDGLSRVTEMLEAAAADNQPALAITDHGVCASHPWLQREAAKTGIKPIFGMEAYFVPNRHERDKDKLHDYNHLVLLAQTDKGLRNLWALSTRAHREGFYGKPRCDWELLEEYREGLICTTACLSGPLSAPIMAGDETKAVMNLGRFQAIFGDNLFIELHTNHEEQQAEVNDALISLSKTHGVPMLAVVDSHYPCAADKDAHKLWIAIQTNTDVGTDADLFAGESSYHLMSGGEVAEALSYLPGSVVHEAIANTVTVAESCTAQIVPAATSPVFSKKGGVNRDKERLIDLCIDNWEKRVGGKPHQAIYEARFEREVRLLVNKDFCGYFLLVWDYVKYAKEHGILVGPGRGSGGGSLVAYLLGITELDPIECNLMFERFITEGRTELPDFDVDFPSSTREIMHTYIVNKYGADSVVRVGTHMRLKNKSVVQSLARVQKNVMKIDFPDVKAFSEFVDLAEADTAGLGLSWTDLWDQHGEILNVFRERYPELFKTADRLVGRLRGYGKHPAGMVIDPQGALVDMLPLRMADDGQMISEFDMKSLEELGLGKCDFLFLRTLDTIQQNVDLVNDDVNVIAAGAEVNVYEWREEFEDPEVWDMICAGHVLGIFQIETSAGKKEVLRLQPRSVNDLAAVITLVRPGPTRSGLTATYHRRRMGIEDVTYPDPRLEEVLSGSLGCMIYQEDIMAVCQVMGGYTLSEADEVRKLLGKKQVEKVEEEGRRFVQRCIANDTDPGVAARLWEQMAEFAKYSFNRTHAYGYAVLAYYCAWLKCHYPLEFLCSALSTVDKDRIPDFVDEARRLGIKVLPPDINVSGKGFGIEPGAHTVRYGFDSVKGVGDGALKALLLGQPYASWDDFMERKGSQANMGVLKLLAALGAFDSLRPNRAALVAELEWIDADSPCQFKDQEHVGPNDLPCRFDWDSEPMIPKGKRGLMVVPTIPKRCTKACRHYTARDFGYVVPYTQEQVMEKELEFLGVYLTVTPFDRIPADVLASCKTGAEIDVMEMGSCYVAAIVKSIRPRTDKNGNPMGFVTLHTPAGDVDAVVFKDVWSQCKSRLKLSALCFAAVTKNRRGCQMTELEVV
jgi:DNA polymerase-3 subunit alpha